MDINELTFNEELCMYHLDSVLELGYIRQDILNEKMEFNLKSIINRIIEFVRETFKRISAIFSKFKRYILSKINKKNNSSVDNKNNRDNNIDDDDNDKGNMNSKSRNNHTYYITKNNDDNIDNDIDDDDNDRHVQKYIQTSKNNTNLLPQKMTRAEAKDKIFGKNEYGWYCGNPDLLKYIKSHNKIKFCLNNKYAIITSYYPNNILFDRNGNFSLRASAIGNFNQMPICRKFYDAYSDLIKNHKISDTKLYDIDTLRKLRQDSLEYLVQGQKDYKKLVNKYGDLKEENLHYFIEGTPVDYNNTEVEIDVLYVYNVAMYSSDENKLKPIFEWNRIIDNEQKSLEDKLKKIDKLLSDNTTEIAKKDIEVVTSLIRYMCHLYSALATHFYSTISYTTHRAEILLRWITEFYIDEEIRNS